MVQLNLVIPNKYNGHTKMHYTQVVLMSCLLATTLLYTPVSAKCNTCSINGIACVSESSFLICTKGVPDASQVYQCPAGHVCIANSVDKCVAGSRSSADCAAEQNACGVCNGNKLFTCLTPTTFAQCNSTSLLRSVSGNCPSGLTCDSSRPEICVVGGAECST
ncbi:uncharacterized protein LOC105210500 [Zeugodacus cucurbitae]|uniref:Transmembrane domain-containing protein DDB_G0287209 n=1 Tax=Zeugodacus cucurbitae TaxID=28588 RepID=A0A0A1XNF7_ZEUCU|nr:uncharacterized protein LOC105210500 [Zeugodacus cucurbitae]